MRLMLRSRVLLLTIVFGAGCGSKEPIGVLPDGGVSNVRVTYKPVIPEPDKVIDLGSFDGVDKLQTKKLDIELVATAGKSIEFIGELASTKGRPFGVVMFDAFQTATTTDGKPRQLSSASVHVVCELTDEEASRVRFRIPISTPTQNGTHQVVLKAMRLSKDGSPEILTICEGFLQVRPSQ